ncbi:MAG: hypothetical protein DLM54_11560 [Acidimicrobiales bacterium]|nr:MAG: hypothetical protein DLM54_11560 [Acidimicrobiales bacterium]
MKIQRAFRRRLRTNNGGVRVVADLNAAVSANISEPSDASEPPGSEASAASHQVTEIVQQGASTRGRRRTGGPGNRS